MVRPGIALSRPPFLSAQVAAIAAGKVCGINGDCSYLAGMSRFGHA
jgi:hypothetical protein